jgi:NADH-quinone oxidoreductase subunit J
LKKDPSRRPLNARLMIETALFYLFALLTLGGGILTITRRSAVLAAVWLTVSLLGVAGLFLLLGAEFLFVAQIVVYIAGITLLFLFVIMLVNLDASARLRQFRKGWPIVLCAALGLGAELAALLAKNPAEPVAAIPSAGNTEAIADLLFSRYFVAFELASILLLVAIVGSIWMGHQRKAAEGER